MVKLQKLSLIKYFYYPAISYLKMEDAKKGIHAGYFDNERKWNFINLLNMILNLKILL